MKSYYKSDVKKIEALGKDLGITGDKVKISEDELHEIVNDFFDTPDMKNGAEMKNKALKYIHAGKPVQLGDVSLSYR